MVLGFKPQFKEKIINGTKIHTIRIDKGNRWKPDMKIHFATGVRTKNYDQFKEGLCHSVQDIELNFTNNSYSIIIDGRRLEWEECKTLAMWDGFNNVSDLINFFGIRKNIKAKLIHWTNFKY